MCRRLYLALRDELFPLHVRMPSYNRGLERSIVLPEDLHRIPDSLSDDLIIEAADGRQVWPQHKGVHW